jgi:5,10-methylenetetrahydrofolate reductase
VQRFRAALESGVFAVTTEFSPPKGTDVTALLASARALVGRVHGVNITDNTAASLHASPLALGRLLHELGHDPILQLTTRDRNRLALQSDLLGAHLLGLRNVLCLTGDPVGVGDHPDAKPVFDLDGVELLRLVDTLNRGRDMAGHALAGRTELFAGAAASPAQAPADKMLARFREKVEAGARFFQTQAVFDPAPLAALMPLARRLNVKVLAGVLLLRSAAMAEAVNAHVPGIDVPAALIERLRAAPAERAGDVGVEIALETIAPLRGLADGLHLMAPRAENRVLEILERAKL